MFVFSQKASKMQKEALMNISSIVTPSSHPKSIINSIVSNAGLPFNQILSSEVISSAINEVPYRERYGFYPPDITLWAFLSQVLDADHSLDAAVSRIIAFHISRGVEETISSSTSAYSQARKKLSEEMISNLARKSAEQMEEVIPKNWLWRMLNH